MLSIQDDIWYSVGDGDTTEPHGDDPWLGAFSVLLLVVFAGCMLFIAFN